MEIAKFLVEQGAEINAKTVDGMTPLHQAARQGQFQVVRYLLGKKADPNSNDEKGTTAAQWAVKNGHTNVADEINRFVSR